MNRPELTQREADLLATLKLMRGWCMHKLEPVLSGSGAPHEHLQRDMRHASRVIEEATGGNEL